MKINSHLFEVFNREEFIYRKNAEGAEQIRKEYSTAWNNWKEIVKTALIQSGNQELVMENTEKWQNSGNLSSRFWTRIKDANLFKKPSCIAAMISKDNVRVYLEWHGYKNEHLTEERKIHNTWLQNVENWVREKHVDPKEYRVWTTKEALGEFEQYHTLEEYLNNRTIAEQFQNIIYQDSKKWIRVGRIFPKTTVLNNHKDISEEMGKTIDQLEWIYRKAVRPKEQSIKIKPENPPSHVSEKMGDYKTNLQLVEHIHTFIKSKGFFYSKKDVVNLFLSLRSKPFVILSGISGTGKTKIVQWFAESLGATEMNGQFKLIPVRPDWNDGSDLLGYVDIKGEFKKGPLTEMLIQANENLNIPFFVLLDEMNLARVEYYFSDILSVMESQRWQDGKLVTSKLLSEEIPGYDEDIRIPPNLYIIGTVNMDETTHPFSKKVLDRANTIEFNNIELSNLSFLEELEEVKPVRIFHDKISSKYIHLKDVYSDYSNLVRTTTEELEKINKSLEKLNAQVGYRVRDEICFYLVYNHQDKLLDYNEAFDYCILQKILPRIVGSDTRVEKLLKQLYFLFTNKEFVDGDSYDEVINNAKYPNSARKVMEMLRGLQDGFTSFWIS